VTGNLTGPGKASVTTVTSGFLGKDEVQQLSITATGGTFTVSFEGQVSTPIAFDADAATVQSALEALSTIGAGNVTVAGGPGSYTVTFAGVLGDRNVTQLVVSPGGLTGTGDGAVQTTVQGHAEGFEGAKAMPCDPEKVTGSSPGKEFEAQLENIEPKTLYHVLVRAENAGGVDSEETTFTTPALPPTVGAGLVGALTDDSARLSAYVDANNTTTTASFEYDTDPGFGSPVAVPGGVGTTINGNGNKVAFADISGLDPQSTYYWRVAVQSAEGDDADESPRGFKPWPVLGPDQGGVGVEGRRHYELISSDESKPVNRSKMSNDGNRVVFEVTGGSDDTNYAAPIGLAMADRTPTGWKTSNPMPSRQLTGEPYASLAASSPDLKKLAFMREPILFGTGDKVISRYEPDTGSFLQLATIPEVNFAGRGVATPLLFASDDLEHMYGVAWAALIPEDPAPKGGLYDFGSGQAELVGLLPGDVAPACGVRERENMGEFGVNSSRQNWVSRDGSRVFFHTQGNGTCEARANLYMREGGVDGLTRLISGPPLSGPDQGGRFIQATPDGGTVFLSTATKLEPRDLNENPDIYRYTVGSGNFCITCAVPDAQVLTPPSPPSPAPESILIAENGSRAYFTSLAALRPGATPGAINLYTWSSDDPEEIEFVAPMPNFIPFVADFNSTINSSGSALIFRSDAAEMNALSGSDGNGLPQYYRYDGRDRTISCITCPPDGTPAERESFGGLNSMPLGTYSDPQMMTADGRTVVFLSLSSLVANDVNGRPDLYEWHEGRVALITDGVSSGGGTTAAPHFAGAISPDGRDFLFSSSNDLVPAAKASGLKLYDARTGPGFATVVPPVPCAGEGCRGPGSEAPPAVSPATPAFVGPGNQRPAPAACKKPKQKKKGRCVKPKQKKKKAKPSKRASANRGGNK
jgi:hypothetical protein